MLATKLNLSADDAERWIVNLIRNAKLDAKIDAKEVRLLTLWLLFWEPPPNYSHSTKLLMLEVKHLRERQG